MRYEEIIQTISEIVNNENIHTDGLTLVYHLNSNRHRQLDEHLFYKGNPINEKFEHREVIEVELGGVLVKFIEEGSEIKFNKKDLDN